MRPLSPRGRHGLGSGAVVGHATDAVGGVEEGGKAMNLRLLGIVVGFLCLFTSIAFLLSRPAGDRTYSARRSIVLVPRFFSLESLRAGWYLTWRLGPIIAAFAFSGIIFRFYSLCGGTSWEPLVINLMIFLFFTSI